MSGQQQKSREEVEAELRKPIKAMPGRLAQNLFTDPEFKRAMNRWTRGVHLRFAVSMAFTFIGLNYLTIYLQNAFVVQPQYFAAFFGTAGVGMVLWQMWMDRKPKPEIPA